MAAVIVVHILCALAAGLYPVFIPVNDNIDDLAVAIFAVSQMSLLSLWLIFGRLHWSLRVFVVIAGGAWLTFLIHCAEEGGWPSWSQITPFIAGFQFSVVMCAAIAALVARKRGWRVDWSSDPGKTAARGSLQFSLGRLMLGMLVLSLLMGAARLLAAWSTVWTTGAAMFVVALMMGLICGSIAIASLWASLSAQRPLARIVLVVIFAAGAGLMTAYTTGAARAWIAWLIIAAFVALIAVLINVSLLGIRLAGFRVVVRHHLSAAPPTLVSARETASSNSA